MFNLFIYVLFLFKMDKEQYEPNSHEMFPLTPFWF